MPLVRSVASLADGFTIVLSSGATHTFTSANLSAAQKADTIANVESFINGTISSSAPVGEFAAVHLTSVVPLQGQVIVSNDPISGSWWL